MPFKSSFPSTNMKWTKINSTSIKEATLEQAENGLTLESCCIRKSIVEKFQLNPGEMLKSGLLLIDCLCEPRRVRVGKKHPRLDQEDPPNKLINDHFDSGQDRSNCEITIKIGNLLIWSENTANLSNTHTMHKTILVFPWADVEDRLHKRIDYTSGTIDSSTGIGALLHSHISALSTHLPYINDNESAAVRRATVEMVASALGKESKPTSSLLSKRYLSQLKDYILRNLSKEDLTPTSIAIANKMTPRYVHLLFSQTGMSASQWIRKERLERCKDDLLKPKLSETNISEIGYAWGFKDPTNFSRAFKNHFGITPKDFRKIHSADRDD